MHTECCCRRCCCCSVFRYCCCCCSSGAAAGSCCCSSSCAGWQKIVAGSLNLIPVLSFSSFKLGLFFSLPLGSTFCRFYGLDFPTSSVFTVMCGAKAGVCPPRWIPPCITMYQGVCVFYICTLFSGGFLRALGCSACRGAACTHGATLGRGRAPWRVLWVFKVAKSS